MVIKLGNIYGFTGGNFSGNVYSAKGIAPTLNTMQGGNKQPLIIVENHKKRMDKIIHIGNVNPSGRGQSGSVVDSRGLARTVTVGKGEGQKILEVVR